MTKTHQASRLASRSFSLSPALLVLLALGCSSSDPAATQHPPAVTVTPEGPEPAIPAAPPECPTLQSGTVNVLGEDVLMFVGEKRTDKKGPVLFYWHGTGSTPEEISVFMNSGANP